MLQNWLIDWICSFFIQISWGPCHQSSVLSKKNDFMSLFLVLESSSVARKSRMKLSLASFWWKVLFLSHPHHNFWDRRPLEESQTHFQKNLNCEFFLSQWLLCFVIVTVNQWSVSSLHFYLRKRRKLTVLDFKHLPSKQLKASIRRFSASVQAKCRHAGGVNEYDIVGIV